MIRAVLLLLSLTLSACVTVVAPPLPSLTLAPAARPADRQTDLRPVLWYVGLGLYDETWSEGDVVAAAAALSAERSNEWQVVPFVFGYGLQHRYPPPSPANVIGVMTDIARRARPTDVVVLYVSTHGAPGRLARQADGRELPPATAEEVGAWLAPLGSRPTVVILSACFSGSFIPALRADNRIILAAARPDRTSFGCQAGADHTVYGEALLDALATPSTSLRAIVDRVRRQVAVRERQLRVTQPSEPQVSVGPAASALFEAPIF